MSRNKKTSIIANINLFLSHQQAPTINFTINSCKTVQNETRAFIKFFDSFSSENYVNSLRNIQES